MLLNQNNLQIEISMSAVSKSRLKYLFDSASGKEAIINSMFDPNTY